MKTIYATAQLPSQVPTIRISHGAGNLPDAREVHIAMEDFVTGNMIQGWFRLSEIEMALQAAHTRRLTEPVDGEAA